MSEKKTIMCEFTVGNQVFEMNKEKLDQLCKDCYDPFFALFTVDKGRLPEQTDPIDFECFLWFVYGQYFAGKLDRLMEAHAELFKEADPVEILTMIKEGKLKPEHFYRMADK